MVYRYSTSRRVPGFDVRSLEALAHAGIEGTGFRDGTGSYAVKVGWASPEAAAAKLNAHLGFPPGSDAALTSDSMRPAG
jgi:hypothetical protein